jgi:hypothetical protein
MKNEEIKLNLSSSENWIRGLFVLLFVVIYGVAELVVYLIAIFQFLTLIISGKTNDAVAKFAKNLNYYVYEILEFITFNTEDKPFPFKDFPSIKVEEEEEATPVAVEPKVPTKNTDHDENEITPVG